MVDQTALVVLVPQAEPVVGSWRLDHDPVASRGMPAHVTILYPFLSPATVGDGARSTLRRIFAAHPAFPCTFPGTGTFPGVLHLAPDPDEPFRVLTHSVTDAFPDTPPYGGAIADPDPHLTVAHADDPDELTEIEIRFTSAARNLLPVRTTVTQVWLMESRRGVWSPREAFSLGSSNPVRHPAGSAS